MILPVQDTEAVPGLEAFTIVANDGSMENAKALAVEIYEDYGISLPVVHCDNFAGDYGIYLNMNKLEAVVDAAIKEMEQFDDVIEVEPVDVTAE